ncbi:VanZ family protein [Methylomagnum sp.]
MYGSLIPFFYRDLPWPLAWSQFLRIPYLHLATTSRADWIANILLYIPLAYLGSAAVSRWLERSQCQRADGKDCRPGFSPTVRQTERQGRAKARPTSALDDSRDENALGARAGRSWPFLAVFAGCVGFAVAVEFTQVFFPRRTVSLNDIYAETLGSGLGVVAWCWLGDRIETIRRALANHSAETPRLLILLYGAAYLGLAVFPFDFLVSGQEFAWRLNGGGWGGWLAPDGCDGTRPCAWAHLSEIIAAAPLGLGFGLWWPRRGLADAARWGLGLGVALEAIQLLTASNIAQGASIVLRALGVVLGYAVFRGGGRDWLRPGLRTLAHPLWWAPMLLLYGGALVRLTLMGKGAWLSDMAATERLMALHFLPFYYHYFTTEAHAVESLTHNLALYAPIGAMVFVALVGRRRQWGYLLSGGLTVLAVCVVEGIKLYLPKAHPDPTNLLIGPVGAMAGYWLAWTLCQSMLPDESGARVPGQSVTPARIGPASWVGAALTAGVGVWLLSFLLTIPSSAIETVANERFYPRPPEPWELPAAHLPGFRHAHPRLPAPSEAELAKLRADNPGFIMRRVGQAQRGAGAFDAAIFAAYIRAEPFDRALLFRRLMALQFTERGDEQVKPLAQAYDWLYERWTPEQRAMLLDKTLAGCRYEIDFIREERLSPYNVFLYNSPLQALMACAIAVYGDSPKAETVMGFAHDYWKNRVLPVWRHIMGKNGGWHEGGEYVGIGIGQAAYQLPALWRAATGENLFATEPGLRGFLDFLIYRTRPDGTYLRLGDGGFFQRGAPDRIPLAIEYQHPAAYSLGGCPPPNEPSAWPWGPLTRPDLCDPAAVTRLPLERLFDGVGLVVARSGWDADATLVTFKAGDNFWSHSHLDQGSFTIYKGGALAIDSGLYGPRYGSDHHMNYTYQTIAHNAITVTDPYDTAPMPTAGQPRIIANDGGQRRVGSGWGQEPAPMDRAEWERKRALYHTGALLAYAARKDLVVAVADVTPAYNNLDSRRGSFFARTRRVERLIRTFIYDRVNDAVVVHDRVRATDPNFVKRSLLHSLEPPVRTEFGFRVQTPAEPGPGKSGGVLDVHVLWPDDAFIDIVGGPGAEFLVGGRNYDGGGEVWNLAGQRPGSEPGRWRVEIKPRRPAPQDDFLMILKPRIVGRPEPNFRISKLVGPSGCQIEGPQRRLMVTFPEGSGLPSIRLDGEVFDMGGAGARAIR